VVPYEEYVQKWARTRDNRGLLSAKGALADIEDIDEFVKNIYEARENSTDRNHAGM